MCILGDMNIQLTAGGDVSLKWQHEVSRDGGIVLYIDCVTATFLVVILFHSFGRKKIPLWKTGRRVHEIYLYYFLPLPLKLRLSENSN